MCFSGLQCHDDNNNRSGTTKRDDVQTVLSHIYCVMMGQNMLKRCYAVAAR